MHRSDRRQWICSLESSLVKYKKLSTEQHKNNRLCVEWVLMDFVPFYVLEHLGFRHLMNNANARYHTISRNTVKNGLIDIGNEVDEFHQRKSRLLSSQPVQMYEWLKTLKDMRLSQRLSSIKTGN